MADGHTLSTTQSPHASLLASRGLNTWLAEKNLSFGFTSYRTGRLYMVGLVDDGRLSFHQRQFERAMGVHASGSSLVLATGWQIWRMENVLKPGQRFQDCDACFVPRVAYITGDLDAHDVVLDQDDRVIFVNTKYSCLATLDPVHSFDPVWTPSFISKLAPEDRCHLNGLAMEQSLPRYVTSVSQSDGVSGWRDRRSTGGCILDVNTGDVLTDQLSMPHSPRLHDGQLYVLDSGRGHLCKIDRASGDKTILADLPGFARGLSIFGSYAFIGLSLPRDQGFAGLEIADNLKARDCEAWCGVQIIDLETGNTIHWIRFEADVDELYDTFVLPGIRRPMALSYQSEELKTLITLSA